ncbi:MAG: helix-turn-helix transcriptional regulator [Anaerolineales bacterium]|nr:MAG: helix-turn-helix transcriptional regulator [Anaerolineales bacterium]
MNPDPPLSNREKDVLKLLMRGQSNKQIALSLGIAVRTVEFHLKSIYVKLNVRSRVELILKLVNSTGGVNGHLWDSTVDGMGKNFQNGNRLASRMKRAESLQDAVVIIGREFKMKNLFNTKHVLVAVSAALLAGLLWALIWIVTGNFPTLQDAFIPMMIILPMLGLAVGFVGKQSDIALRRVFFSALSGAAVSPLLIVPLMLLVVFPLGKLAEQIGLIDPATMPASTATLLTMIVISAIWLVIGVGIGIALLFMAIKKPNQHHVSEYKV